MYCYYVSSSVATDGGRKIDDVIVKCSYWEIGERGGCLSIEGTWQWERERKYEAGRGEGHVFNH